MGNPEIIDSRTPINIEQSFKIEAGPGAGKTEFLVNHINHVIANSQRLGKTRKIACITYTNNAVDNISSKLGKSQIDKVEISTIHSFLYKNIIKPFEAFIPKEYELNIEEVDGHDDFNVNTSYVNEWLANKYFDSLKPPYKRTQFWLYKEQLENWLSTLKCDINTKEILWDCDNTKSGIYKNGKYQQIKQTTLNIFKQHLIDFKKIYWRNGKLSHDDVLYFSYILIKQNNSILEIIRAKFPYIFIDEYQDTSKIQNYIVTGLMKKEITVGVIGDRAQSIYGFQGASPDQFDKIQTEKTYKIEDNHRSNSTIVSFLNTIRSDLTQESLAPTQTGNIYFLSMDKLDAYDKAKELCSNTAQPLVTLARNNLTVNYMKLSIEKDNCENPLNILNTDQNSTRANAIWNAVQSIEYAKKQQFKESLKYAKKLPFTTQGNKDSVALQALNELLMLYPSYSKSNLITFNKILKSNLALNISNIQTGSTKTNQLYSNLTYQDLVASMNIPEDKGNHLTIHKAKGLEFDNVLLLGNEDTKHLLLKPNLKNEEERIIYVACSRAKQNLFIQINNISDCELQKIKSKYPNWVYMIEKPDDSNEQLSLFDDI